MKNPLCILLGLLLLFGSACAELCLRMDEGALLLTRDAQVIVPLGEYEDIVPLGDGLYASLRDGSYALMDETGALRSEFAYSFLEHAGGALIAETDGLRCLLSPGGAPLTPAVYTSILPAGDGRFWAIRGNGSDLESDELFLLDIKGNETATGLYIRRMRPAGEGMLAVMLPVSGLWGYCDAEAVMRVPDRYDHAGSFLGGRAAIVENGLYGAICADGQTVIDPGYDYLEVCAGGYILAGLSQQGVWVFDPDGNEIARHEGEETAAAPVGDGYAVYDGESVTLRAFSGETLSRGEQDASFSEGLNGAYILADGPWGEECVGIVGSERRYQNLYPLGFADGVPLYACMQANSARFINDLLGEVQVSVDMDSARYGVVNDRGEILIPAEYESVQCVGDDRLLCHVEGLWQLMDSGGRVYWSHGVRQTEEPSF